MEKFININDANVWTLEEMKLLRKDEKRNGFNVYDSFEEWLENKLDTDFERREFGDD